MISFLRKLFPLVMAMVMVILPCKDYSAKSDDVLLSAGIISDVHIDYRLALGESFLKKAFLDMNSNTSGTDVAVITGDLTNYGDKDSHVDFFDILTQTSESETKVVAMGNHDIGHTSDLGMTNQEARDQFLALHNEYLGTDFEHNYYTIDAKGYKFIVLCDESEDNWDQFEIYDEQIEFLDTELAKATADGKPAFVICHEPVEGVNGQQIIWKNGAIESEASTKIKAVMEKYKNVFYISGHMHSGINGYITKSVLDFECVETLNGVTYVSIPTYLLVNRYGIPWNGIGMQMEVYQDKVIFRARDYLVSVWKSSFEFTVDLV